MYICPRDNQDLQAVDQSFARLWSCHLCQQDELLDKKVVVNQGHLLKLRCDLRLAQFYSQATFYLMPPQLHLILQGYLRYSFTLVVFQAEQLTVQCQR